jgi:hypothetical protein
VRLDNDPNFDTEKANKAFSGVEELTIEVFQAQYGSADHRVLRLFEGVRGVTRARVYGSVVKVPRYVEWLQNAMMSPKGTEVAAFDPDGDDLVSAQLTGIQLQS